MENHSHPKTDQCITIRFDAQIFGSRCAPAMI